MTFVRGRDALLQQLADVAQFQFVEQGDQRFAAAPKADLDDEAGMSAFVRELTHSHEHVLADERVRQRETGEADRLANQRQHSIAEGLKDTHGMGGMEQTIQRRIGPPSLRGAP